MKRKMIKREAAALQIRTALILKIPIPIKKTTMNPGESEAERQIYILPLLIFQRKRSL